MHKFNYVCSIILVVSMPLMIVILTSNLILRMSEPYVYHFNDSQVISEIPYNVTGSEMADGISSYWSSLDGESFQVYEKNGDYEDPIFKENEQRVMAKAKYILNIELAAGLFCMAITIAIYVYLWKNGFREALRNRYFIGAGLTAGLLAAQGVLWCIKGVRAAAYHALIGITLSETETTLVTVLGDPFFKTYVIFASIVGAAVLALLTYINHNLTKPARIFY